MPLLTVLKGLMHNDTRIGIVTAAGYTEAEKYYGRLHGLLLAVKESTTLTDAQKQNLVVMGLFTSPPLFPFPSILPTPDTNDAGGESNFLFRYNPSSKNLLEHLPRRSWILPSMKTSWLQPTITKLLDLAESSLRECVANLSLEASVLRKERAVGIIPLVAGYKFPRESLEETVLVIQKKLEMSEVGQLLPFCAFNGGNDVFVDIGDKSWGVLVCQKYFGSGPRNGEGDGDESGKIMGERTLHVGDQFLSAGSNDFKARVVGTTAWIANPTETVDLLDELLELMDWKKEGKSTGDN